ncbi:MAG: hypothetical protein GY888_07795, partial [Planctomycetaceae bacterium]|nr:hypothetical protein [Planctomycetaceae bacterium]
MRVFLEVLGLGYTDELPPLTMTGNDRSLAFGNEAIEPVYPGYHDQVHLQHLYRKDSVDIDLYQIDVTSAGLITFETFAERKLDPSSLDTVLRLYRELTDEVGNVVGHELIAQNDDYFSEDSFIELELTPGIYYIGVSATGNDSYDPAIPGTGADGVTQGDYDLRVTMRPEVDTAIEDAATGRDLDGDLDGQAGGVHNNWFRAAGPVVTGQVNVPGTARAVFVDKEADGFMDGSLEHPFANIDDAFASSNPGDIVRILGNRQVDQEGVENDTLKTLAETQAYELGFSRLLGTPLADGAKLRVPQGVTVMIDQTAVLKLRRAEFGLGSTDAVVDRSGSALQVLGTPRLFKWNQESWLSLVGQAGSSLLEGDQLQVTD